MSQSNFTFPLIHNSIGIMTPFLLAAIGGLFTDPPTTTDFTTVNKGDRLPGSLEHSATWAFDYELPVNQRFDANFHVNGSYRSDTPAAFPAAGEGLHFYEIDGFTMWDASVTLNADSWSIGLFVDNIGDEQGITGGHGAGQETRIGQYRFVTRPRTIGLRFRYAPEGR